MASSDPLAVPSFLLECAIEVLEERGWCQQARVLQVSPTEKRCCLTASLVEAMGYELVPDMKVGAAGTARRTGWAWSGVTRPQGMNGISIESAFLQMGRGPKSSMLAAFRYLRQATGAEDLERWNDLPATTYDDVLDALSVAGALALADGA